MIARGMEGAVAKFMSATHMGMDSKPFVEAFGAAAKPTEVPIASTAIASFPCRSSMVSKSNFISIQSPVCLGDFIIPWLDIRYKVRHGDRFLDSSLLSEYSVFFAIERLTDERYIAWLYFYLSRQVVPYSWG